MFPPTGRNGAKTSSCVRGKMIWGTRVIMQYRLQYTRLTSYRGHLLTSLPYSAFLEEVDLLKLYAMNTTPMTQVAGGLGKDSGKSLLADEIFRQLPFCFSDSFGSSSSSKDITWEASVDALKQESNRKSSKVLRQANTSWCLRRTCRQERTETSDPLRCPIICDSGYSVGPFSS